MRYDLQITASFINDHSRVLDLGCGKGDLLEYLKKSKQVQGYGIERDEEKAIDGIGKGLSILQGDINQETLDYADNSFDYVILSQTLQQVYNPKKVIQEMLRIGRQGIVSFPCFNHISIKLQLLFSSKAPITEELPYEWYDTPNIRVVTLRDFRIFCAKHQIRILKDLAIASHYKATRGKVCRVFPDWLGRYGIFLISK